MNPALQKAGYPILSELGAGWLRAGGDYCEASRAALQSCPTPGLRGRLIHNNRNDCLCSYLRCFAVHSYATAFAVLGPVSGNAATRSFPRLLERRRSNLCNAALDRKQGVIKAAREKQESSTCGTIRMNNL